MNKDINENCVKTVDLINSWLSKNLNKILLIYLIVLLLGILCNSGYLSVVLSKIRGKLKRSSPKNNFIESIEIKRDILFLPLQGENLSTSPWFLDLDISKDFQSFFDKRDYFILGRVILNLDNLGNQQNIAMEEEIKV